MRLLLAPGAHSLKVGGKSFRSSAAVSEWMPFSDMQRARTPLVERTKETGLCQPLCRFRRIHWIPSEAMAQSLLVVIRLSIGIILARHLIGVINYVSAIDCGPYW